MRQFNNFEQKIISELIATSHSEMIRMTDFLKQVFFTLHDQQSMIIQTKAKYAVFYIPVETYSDHAQKKTAVQNLLNLISLLSYLRSNGYLTVYIDDETREKTMFFINEGFITPKPSTNKIILNPDGDYTNQPEFIRNNKDEVIYKGVIFNSATYELIVHLFTGVLCVSDTLKEALNPDKTPAIIQHSKKVNSDTPIEDPHVKPQKHDTYFKSGIVILLALLCGITTFTYFKSTSHAHQLTSLQSQQHITTSLVDSTLKKVTTTAQLHQQLTTNTIDDEKRKKYYGVDLSRWNGNALEEITSKDSISFVICKATQGVSYQDPDFEHNWKTTRSKGWIRGTYHFYMTNEDPIQQADHFWNVIQTIDSTDIAPIVDIEEKSLPEHQTVDPVNLQVDLLQFLKRLEQKSGRTPIIYADLSFANKYLSNASFAQHPLWLAEYTRSTTPKIPKTWEKKGFKIWQKSDHYSIDSHLTDFDIFVGKRSQLYAK